VLKRDLLRQVKSPLEIELMQRVKRAFDPDDILNPGKVL
jgi:FAD/FMN-containing dehydrogenase